MAKATDIPQGVRKALAERDRGLCRMCGRGGQAIHLHHVVYRSQERNNHDPSNLISLCARCHKIAHAHPSVVRPALQYVIEKPWVTALAYLRQAGTDLRILNRGSL